MIRVESEETQDYARETLAISQEKKQRKWASCRAPSVNHEDPFNGVSIVAVKKTSDSGRLLRWLLKKLLKPAQSICVKQCCNEKMVQRSKQPQKLEQRKGVVETKADRGRLWKVFGSGCTSLYFTLGRAGARKNWRTLLEKNKNESKVSGNRSLFAMEQVKRSADTVLIPSRVTLIGISENSWYGSKSLEKNHLMFKTTTGEVVNSSGKTMLEVLDECRYQMSSAGNMAPVHKGLKQRQQHPDGRPLIWRRDDHVHSGQCSFSKLARTL